MTDELPRFLVVAGTRWARQHDDQDADVECAAYVLKKRLLGDVVCFEICRWRVYEDDERTRPVEPAAWNWSFGILCDAGMHLMFEGDLSRDEAIKTAEQALASPWSWLERTPF